MVSVPPLFDQPAAGVPPRSKLRKLCSVIMSTVSPACSGPTTSIVSVPCPDVAVKWMKPSDDSFAVAFDALKPVMVGVTVDC